MFILIFCSCSGLIFFYKNMLEYVFADKSRICFDFLTGLKPKNNASSCILQNGTSQGVITASAFIPIICIIFYSTALSRRVEKKMKKLLMKSLFRVSLLFAYALFGGGLFYCIEKKPEDNRDVYLRLSRELQTNFTNRFNVSIMENDFKSFIHRAFEVVQVGHKADWSFLSSSAFRWQRCRLLVSDICFWNSMLISSGKYLAHRVTG